MLKKYETPLTDLLEVKTQPIMLFSSQPPQPPQPPKPDKDPDSFDIDPDEEVDEEDVW